MAASDADAVTLVHRRKSPMPGVRKTLRGLTPLVVAVVSLVVLLRADGEGPLRTVAGGLLAASGAVLICWGAWWLVDGITDLLAWRVLQHGPRNAMRLSAWGVEYDPSWRGGGFRMSVPWSEVTGAEFRPGLGSTPIFCVAADGRHPAPPDGGPLRHPRPSQPSDRALARADAQEPAPDTDRAMLANAHLFGTPMVVDLKLCEGLDVDELDRLLQRWTDGRCRCLPPDWVRRKWAQGTG
ncbi:hypothetical protein GCM10010420_39880 [Streptomyces glaucosporus]|uniref:Integral membrane protein n=1 Tax=Streptomyces glaucosporus TaxID=284044 RepID=A0ABP5VSH0_9ACTN